MTALKCLGTRFVTWQPGAYLRVHLSNKESETKQSTYRSTDNWTFVVGTFPWTRFQTRSTGDGTMSGTLVVNAALTAGLLAFAVASLVLGMTRESTKMLAIQRTLARMPSVVYALDWSRPNLVDVQILLLTIPTPSLALRGTAAHWLIAQFSAKGGGGVLAARNPFRMFAVWKPFQDHLLTLDRVQILEHVAERERRFTIIPVENSDF